MAIRLQPDSAGGRNNLGNILRGLGRRDDAIAAISRRLSGSIRTLSWLITIAAWRCAARQGSRSSRARFRAGVRRSCRIFGRPSWPCAWRSFRRSTKTASEIAVRRGAYAGRLAKLSADVESRPGTCCFSPHAIGSHQPFYLPYQGCDDRELQTSVWLACLQDYGRDIPHAGSCRSASRTCRSGWVSSADFSRQHSNWKIPIKGWLQQSESGYFTRPAITPAANGIARPRRGGGIVLLASYRARYCSTTGGSTILADRAACSDLSRDRDGQSVGATGGAAACSGSMRFVVSLVSSGFPTIDYFISSDLMEPLGAAAALFRTTDPAPESSIYYEPADVPAAGMDLVQLGSCAQALWFIVLSIIAEISAAISTSVFAHIAAEVPDCQFTFIEFGGGRGVTEMFRADFSARSKPSASTPEIIASSCRYLHRIVSSRRSVNVMSCWTVSAGRVATRSARALFTISRS